MKKNDLRKLLNKINFKNKKLVIILIKFYIILKNINI